MVLPALDAASELVGVLVNGVGGVGSQMNIGFDNVGNVFEEEARSLLTVAFDDDWVFALAGADFVTEDGSLPAGFEDADAGYLVAKLRFPEDGLEHAAGGAGGYDRVAYPLHLELGSGE